MSALFPLASRRIATLEALKARIRTLERPGTTSPTLGRGPLVATGWPSLDATLSGGLPRGVVCEWLGLDEGRPGLASCFPAACSAGTPDRCARTADAGDLRTPLDPTRGIGAPAGPRTRTDPSLASWVPPLSLLLHVAHRAVARRSVESMDVRPVLWIGRRTWPYPVRLVSLAAGEAGTRLLSRSLFVDPPDDGARLWAIDLALRCPAIAAVIADGHGLSMAASRRLQLAAEAGRALALLVRPASELASPSAAALRFLVEREEDLDPGVQAPPRWRLSLQRAKGSGIAQIAKSVSLEGSVVHGVVESAVALPAHVVDGPRATPAARARRRAARVVAGV